MGFASWRSAVAAAALELELCLGLGREAKDAIRRLDRRNLLQLAQRVTAVAEEAACMDCTERNNNQVEVAERVVRTHMEARAGMAEDQTGWGIDLELKAAEQQDQMHVSKRPTSDSGSVVVEVSARVGAAGEEQLQAEEELDEPPRWVAVAASADVVAGSRSGFPRRFPIRSGDLKNSFRYQMNH